MNKNLAIEILKKILTTISGKIFCQNVYKSSKVLTNLNSMESFKQTLHSCIISVTPEIITIFKEVKKNKKKNFLS